MPMRFTILGCGSSGGVPRPALGWGACDPSNPKNRRRRCSLLVEKFAEDGRATRVLVDTSPDLREQLIDAEVDWLDGVLFSHPHADHTHGIDDLRPLFLKKRRKLACYLDEQTRAAVFRAFGYIFETPPGSDYPPIAEAHPLSARNAVTITGEGGDVTALPVLQHHGEINSLGFRFGNLAYSADLKDLPPDSANALQGLDCWIVDALRYTPHPSHFSLDETLAWIARLKPKRAALINMHTDIDYDAVRAKLPPGVEPAFDGLRIEI